MRTLKKFLVAFAIITTVALPTQQAKAYWWGNPWYGGWSRHTYIYDPGYRWGAPAYRRYIRNLYLYGPGYAASRWHRYPYYGYGWW